MMNSRISSGSYALAAVTLAGLLAATACGSGSSSASKGSTASGGQSSQFCQNGTTTIAYAGPTSGSEANYGQQQYSGLKLAVAAINSGGGFAAGPLKGCKVKIEGPFDDRSDPSTGATIASRLASDSHLLAYFGNVDSGVTLAALPILSRAGIPVINSYSSNPTITSQGYKNVFRVILNDNTQGGAIAKLLIQKFGLKNLALVWPNDVFGQGISKAFLTEAHKDGANVAVNYSAASDATDYSVAVNKIRSAHVDGIALLGVYTGDAIAVKQLAQAGVSSASTTMIGNASDNTPQFVSIAGTSAAKGVYLVGIWNPGNTSPASTAFVQQFKAAYQSEPAEDAATAYDAAMVFKRAVDSGGGDRQTLIKALSQNTPSNPYAGITGNIGFDSTGQDAAAVPTLLVIKDGKIITAGS